MAGTRSASSDQPHFWLVNFCQVRTKGVTVFDLFTKGWRRNRLIQKPAPGTWTEILSEYFWYWHVLTEPQRKRLLNLIKIFVNEKEIVVPKETQNPEAVRVVVAAAACLMLLGFTNLYCFDRIETIVVTTKPFRQKMAPSFVGGVFHEVVASGVYSKNAPVAVSWRDIRRQCGSPDSGTNVVIHEFAHHVDDLDGTLAGDPPFEKKEHVREWTELVQREMEALENQVRLGIDTVIDPYGLSNPTEFFAVCCEAYFCAPIEFESGHPELFRLLNVLFQVDPRPWFQGRMDA